MIDKPVEYTDEIVDGAFSFLTSPLRRLQVYPDFNYPNNTFNQDAPEPVVSFLIGGFFLIISIIMWLFRLRKLMANTLETTGKPLKGTELIRGGLAVLNDNDDSAYTIVSFSATSFLFLGGFQTNFESTFDVLLVFFFLASLIDIARVLLAYSNYDSLKDVAIYSRRLKAVEKEQEETDTIVEIQPINIYEDFGRESTIVFMIFFTQVLFVSIVCYDISGKGENNCLDGTKSCPVGMTLGSYGFYIIGIFQACVYMLGPKTGFGKSEQNPSFWLIMLLSSKNINEGQILWHNPEEDAELIDNKTSGKLYDGETQILNPDGGEWFHKRDISSNDIRMWLRFAMSYLVNGVGYHILIHALPLQVAQQSSLLGVVFRAVGMMYLVDLDDSKGFKLYITANYSPKVAKASDEEDEGIADPEPEADEPSPFDEPTKEDMALLEAEKEAILEHARDEVSKAMEALDALSRGEKPNFPRKAKKSQVVTQSNLMSFGTKATITTKDPVVKPTDTGAAAAMLQASASGASGVSGVSGESGGAGVEVDEGGPL